MTVRVAFALIAGIAILVLIFSPEKTEQAARRKSKLVLAIATVGLTIGFIGLARQQESLNATNNRICSALSYLSAPVSDKGETGPVALARIKAANVARAAARAKLNETFGCT